MKKLAALLLCALALFLFSAAICEEESDWASQPVITKAYEISAERLYLEWEGSSPLYQVYMDGKLLFHVIVNHAVIPVRKGTHTFTVCPIMETKSANTQMNLKIESGMFGVGGSFDIDLASLGIDPKQLTAGTPSESIYVDYATDPIFTAVPDKLTAETDFEDRVLLSFADKQYADEYFITIKNSADVNYIRFYPGTEEGDGLISRKYSTVTVRLEPEYLEKNGCMVPELNEKYQFTVQLRKYAENMVTGEKEKNVIHESRVSGVYEYTSIPTWKAAPVITYSSQTADGEITLRWAHGDDLSGCEYTVLKINKVLGVKIGEEVWGTTSEKEFTFHDLLNGVYCFAVVPQRGGEKGNLSGEVDVEIKNEWVASPSLKCEQAESGQIKLTWPGSSGVTYYHITVFVGDSASLLRFVDLDYSKYTEFDVPSASGEMEYLFTYDNQTDPEKGLKVKFEICGVRRTEKGDEQKSAVSSQTITMK